MRKRCAIVTGSGGLIGSASVKFLANKGFNLIVGIDNDMRKYFFGKEASTSESTLNLLSTYDNFTSVNMDIRDFKGIQKTFKSLVDDGYEIEIIIHCAAQPSHDWAVKEPITDFSINATGTLNMLENARLLKDIQYFYPTFIFTSTNKVYGDTPNNLELHKKGRRLKCYDMDAIDETMSIDNSTHSIFGASKVAADIMCQEYGKYDTIQMPVGIFRGGCLTGENHAGAELHGFLSYLVKCGVRDDHYTIYGDGYQVRDNIYADDLIEMFWEFHLDPRPGEVYNAGGGIDNSISILEAIDHINKLRDEIGLEAWKNYTIEGLDASRIGDHRWYISDLTKFKNHYPNWKGNTVSVKNIIEIIFNKEIENIQTDRDEFAAKYLIDG